PHCSKSPTAPRPMPWPAPACSARATPTPSTPGWTATRPRASVGSSPTRTGATAGGVFSQEQQRKAQLEERLPQGPGPQDQSPAAPGSPQPAPNRWTLDTIRSTFDWLADYSTSGVWRLLDRLDLRLRSARVQQFSPDPQYADK